MKRLFILFILCLNTCFFCSGETLYDEFALHISSGSYCSAYDILRNHSKELQMPYSKNEMVNDSIISFVKWMQQIELDTHSSQTLVCYYWILHSYVYSDYARNNYSIQEQLHSELVRIAIAYKGEGSQEHRSALTELAEMYDDFNKIEAAASIDQEVLQLYHTQKDIHSEKFMSLLIQISIFYYNHGNYPRSDYYKSEADKIRLNIGAAIEIHDPFTSSLAIQLGDIEEAEHSYLMIVEKARENLGKTDSWWVNYVRKIATKKLLDGDTINANTYFHDAKKMELDNYNESFITYAWKLNELASFYLQTGQYEKAPVILSEAQEIIIERSGTQCDAYAEILISYAQLDKLKGEFTRSIKTYEEALKIKKSIYDNSWYLGQINVEMADVYSMMGNYEQAEAYYIKSIQELREKQPNNYISLSEVELKLANTYENVGKQVEAKSLYENYLSSVKSYWGEKHPNCVRAYHIVGEYYWRHWMIMEAIKLFDEAFSICKNEYINSLEYLSESQRDLFWNRNSHIFQSYNTPLYSMMFLTDKLYDLQLFIKGLLLSSTQLVNRSIMTSGDTLLYADYQKLLSLKAIISQREILDANITELQAMKTEAKYLEQDIVRRSSEYRKATQEWNIRWTDVRDALSKKSVAIEFIEFPGREGMLYEAVFIRKGYKMPRSCFSFSEKELRDLYQINKKNTLNNSYTCFVKDGDTIGNGIQLSQLIWGQILPFVKKGETIYFAPSGLLHQLAIEYLPYDENRTMSDVYNMVRLSSTREIVLNKQKTEYTTATIYGGVQYDLDADTLLAESERYAKEEIQASRGIENDTFNRGNVQYLPGTKKEAETINTLLKENQITAKLYTSSKANEESFKSLSGKHNNILHISTHGFTWTDSVAKKQDFFSQRVQRMGQEQHYDTSIDPLNRCGLLFAGANIALQGNSKNLPEGVQDGILTAKEISLMDLRDADLVVLSACETAKGDITSEGVFGLQRAFKMAGVQTIIMSLWKVNDQATQLLMTEFYNNWIGKHQSKREAFRNAQKTVRTKYEEPEYWAGFVMLD